MDIRIDVEFFSHPKTVKLERRLGLEAVKALMVLWTWAARNRPDGDLAGLENEDIEIAAGWMGEVNKLASTLNALGWLDGEPGAFRLHQWEEHNPWVAEIQSRSDKARLSRMAQTHPVLYAQLIEAGATGISREGYEALTGGVASASDVATVPHSLAPEGKNLAPETLAPTSAPTAQRPVNDRSTTVNDAPAPSPIPSLPPVPSPAPYEKERNSKLPTGLSTELSPKSVNNPTTPTDDRTIREFVRLYRTFPGYAAASWEKERGWFLNLRREYPALNLLEQISRALDWIDRHKDFKVKNARAFFVNWLKKTNKMNE